MSGEKYPLIELVEEVLIAQEVFKGDVMHPSQRCQAQGSAQCFLLTALQSLHEEGDGFSSSVKQRYRHRSESRTEGRIAHINI